MHLWSGRNERNGRVMKYCKRCLEPDTRPDCHFDDEGICLPCRYQETAHLIDWEARHKVLLEIAAWAKTTNVSGYDCVIPVSGGKDSHRQALYVRDELGLKPLLVSCAYPPEEQTERGAHNLANLVELGFDVIWVNPGPETWKRMMRFVFLEFGNLYKASELAIYATAPRIATAYNIPLVVYGENPALSWGSHGGSTDGDANMLRMSNTLKGGDLSPYTDAGFPLNALYWYTYPSEREVERAGLRMIYLGYYIPDFNDEVNSRIALEHGLEGRGGEDSIPEDTGMIYFADALDCDFIMVNQMLKHMKFGFGKTSEQCSGAIRAGRMTREEGVELTRRFDGRCAPRYVRRFCEYLGITEEQFWEVAERYRNPDLWERRDGKWELRYPPE